MMTKLFEADREELLDSMQENGIDRIVNACASLESLKDTEALMEKYPFVYGAFGIHPDDADKMTEETLEEIRKLCKLPKAVAVGEIGLDYYWHATSCIYPFAHCRINIRCIAACT